MKALCVLVGYFFGCFLTAEAVARGKTGKSACRIGSGNPGTANMTALFGLKWGIVTLAGDVGKTMAACALCRYVLFPNLGRKAVLYAGLGTAIGHGFPFWNRFKGGKSVAVTCTYLFLFSPLWGAASELAGLLLRAVTGYPTVGALAIPTLYLVPAFRIGGKETGWVVLTATVLLLLLHWESLGRMLRKTEPKTNLVSVRHRRGGS